MADNELIYKIGLEVDGVESGAKQAESAITNSMKNIKAAVEDANKSLAGMGGGGQGIEQAAQGFHELGEAAEKAMHQMSSALGEGGHLMAGFAQAIQGATSTVGELGATLPALATGIVGVASAMAALALSTAGIGSHLEDLKQQVGGTEADFARLEIMGRQTSLGIGGMASAFGTIRSGIKDAGRDFLNLADTLELLSDRQKNAAESLELHKEQMRIHAKERQGLDVREDKARLVREQEELGLQRQETMVERFTVRMNRTIREMQDNMPGLEKIFLGAANIKVDPSNIDKIRQLGESMMDLRKAAGPDQIIAFVNAMEQLGAKGPEGAAKLDKAMNAVFGPHAARLLREYADQIKETGKLTDEQAEQISQAMGNLSAGQRKALDELKQSMNRAAEAAENMAARIGASFAPLLKVDEMFKSISKTIEQDAEDLRGLYMVLLMVANGFLAVANAAARMVGSTQMANDTLKQYQENEKQIAQIRADNEKHQDEAAKQQAASQPTDVNYWLRKGGQPAEVGQSGLSKEAATTADSIKALGNAANATTQALTGKPQSETAHPSGHASGGLLHGPGSETSDSIPIMASRGEYVINADAVKHYGVGTLHALNAKRLARGGSTDSTAEEAAVAHAAMNECKKDAQAKYDEEVWKIKQARMGPIAEHEQLRLAKNKYERIVADCTPVKQRPDSQGMPFKDAHGNLLFRLHPDDPLNRTLRLNPDDPLDRSNPLDWYRYAAGGYLGFANGGGLYGEYDVAGYWTRGNQRWIDKHNAQLKWEEEQAEKRKKKAANQFFTDEEPWYRYAQGGLLGGSFTGNHFQLGGDVAMASGLPPFLASGLSNIAVNIGSSTNLGSPGGLMQGLHPVNMILPGGQSVGGFTATASALSQMSRVASIQRMTSAGRPSSSFG